MIVSIGVCLNLNKIVLLRLIVINRKYQSQTTFLRLVLTFSAWHQIKMVNCRAPSVFSKTYVTPRRPYEKERLDQELKIIGEYGLRNKREVWRVKYTLAKIRKAARELLTLEEKDDKRLFQGNNLYRARMCASFMIVRLIRMFDMMICLLTPLV